VSESEGEEDVNAVLAPADPKEKGQNSCLVVRRGTTSTGTICHPSFKYWYISLFSLSHPPYDPSKSACFCSCRECRSTSSTMPLMFMVSQSSFISLPSSIAKQMQSVSCLLGGEGGTGGQGTY
jgi:hypothetical protein